MSEFKLYDKSEGCLSISASIEDFLVTTVGVCDSNPDSVK